MKRYLIIALSLVLAMPAFAQRTSEEYATRYDLVFNRLGATGVGLETILKNWEQDFPDDVKMLSCKFAYYYAKAQSSEVKQMDQAKYLGNAPILSLKDSLGNDRNFFEVINYNDEYFSNAVQAVDKAINLNPNELNYRFSKITAYSAYEKDSPDMADLTLKSLIDYHYAVHPKWTYNGEPADNDLFDAAVQEYCYSFFKMGSPRSQEAFREISERMLKYQPNNTVYLSNLGSYNLVVKKDTKTAIKYYSKVLKIKPDDYTAIKNCVLAARADKNVKLEKKYLPLLVKYGASDSEKKAAEARLATLK